MGLFVNPFKKRGTPHHPEVVIGLSRGSPSSPATANKGDTSSTEEKTEKNDLPPPYSGDPAGYSELTLDALRAEVESDIGVSGHDTVYDRTFREFCRSFMHLPSRPPAGIGEIYNYGSDLSFTIQASRRSLTEQFRILEWVVINGSCFASAVSVGLLTSKFWNMSTFESKLICSFV